MAAQFRPIMVTILLFLVLAVTTLDGCPIVRISNNYPPNHATQMTTYTLTDMTSSGHPVYRSDTSDWHLYHIPDKWVIGKTVGATEGYTMFVKSDHFNADEITGSFFIRYHGVWRASPNVHVSCTVENVARGKPASQSSTDGSNNADLAVDGEKGTSVPEGQCTLTNAETGPWWQVDLGRDWPVSTVRVLNRGDCCGRLLQNFEVRIKGEWQSWESSEICGPPYDQTPANGQSITVDCGRPIVGRHVRIQLPERSDTDVLSVCEVEVFPGFGCPAGYLVHGGICYKPNETPMTHADAQATCQEDGGTLAMPRHRHTNQFLTDTAIREDTQSDYWIGLSNQNDTWAWSDGNLLCGFRGWGAGMPSTPNSCAVLHLDGNWKDEPCEATAKFFCQVQTAVDLATVGYQPYGGAFLPAFLIETTFEEAQVACDQFGGGRLAQPTTKEFNDRLMSVAGEASADGSFWIGLKMYEDFWSWSDGTPSETSYSSWAPGEPSGEGCVTTTPAGEWSVKDCDETAFYVCQIGDESLCEMEPHTTVRCGGTVSGSFGHISSPGYGQHLNIPADLDCEWKITVPTGMVIKFTVEDFQMGPNGFLEIFDFCPYGRSVKILSGSVESSLDITNNAHEAFLEFSSNGLQITHGFNISYRAIRRPLGLQYSQENIGTRHKRSVAGLVVKTGLKRVASFVSDLLFNIAGLVFDIVGTVEGEQQHQEVMDKLNLLESKINGIHQEIQDLGIMDELLHEKEIAAQLYAASEQRIKNLHDTLQNRLQITINGTLEPVSLAQVWVETVLRQDSEGMNQALNNMHDMVMGTMTVFDGKSVVETMDALLRKRNHPNAAEKLKRICEYIIDLQLSGYVSWILALKQNGEVDRAKEVMNRADNKLSKQSCFIARFFYGWPAGTYGIPMPSGGCPGGSSKAFEDGHYEFKGHDSFHWSDHLYLNGSLSNNAVKQGVCIKTTSNNNEENWPKGSYCIYKHGNCPAGFRWGRLGFPGGATTGVVPDGSVSGDGIKVEFCCRIDGFASNPIHLPARESLKLFRLGGECQQVDGADVRQGWIDYRGNGHRAGMTPDDDGGDNSHKLYYCSYRVPGSIVSIPATSEIVSAAVPVHANNVFSFVACLTISGVAVLLVL